MGFPFPLPRPESRLCLVASAGENGRLRVNMGYLVSIWVEKISVIAAAVFFYVFVLLRWFHLVCFVLIFVEMFFWIKTRLAFQHARWTCCLVCPCWGQVAFSFPPPSQLEPLLPDMEDDDEAEGKEGRGNVGMAWNGVVVYDMWKRTSAALRWTTLRSRWRIPREAFLLDCLMIWLDGTTRARTLMYEESSDILYASISILWYDCTVYTMHICIRIHIHTERQREESEPKVIGSVGCGLEF